MSNTYLVKEGETYEINKVAEDKKRKSSGVTVPGIRSRR